MGSHVLIASEFLWQITYESLQFLSHLLGIEPIYPDFTIALFQDSADDSHQGCFPCSIRPKQSEHSVADVQRNAAQCLERFFLLPDKRYCCNYLVNILPQIPLNLSFKPVDINVFPGKFFPVL